MAAVVAAASWAQDPAPDANTPAPDATAPTLEQAPPATPAEIPAPAAAAENERPRVATVCPFCKTEQSSAGFFCLRCGRLFRLRHLGPSDRFWGDAYYVLDFPPAADRPSLAADFTGKGLAREAASFYSGERYTLDMEGKKGVAISGEVMAWGTSRGVAYRATVADLHDPGGRLQRRELHGVVKAEPTRYLYRKLEYDYDGDLLSRIESGTWLYHGDSDWLKRPSEWIRHGRAEIHLVYAGGVLIRIETTRREGRKGLRGSLEYTELPPITENVQVDGDTVVALKPSAP